MSALAATLVASLAAAAPSQSLAVVPAVRSARGIGDPAQPDVRLRLPVAVLAGDDQALDHSAVLSAKLKELAATLRLAGEDRGLAEASTLRLALDAKLPEESYVLSVAASTEISLRAGSVAGLAHGSATLLQLLRPAPDRDGFLVPKLQIEDAPAAGYRALMLDVARQPHSVETMRAVIDLAWLYKLRYVQLHLTDDQAFTFAFDPVTGALPKNRSLPLEVWRELARYADARGVTIIPELDLPGHSSKLKQSGYLTDPTPNDRMTDADVAHPSNHARVFRIIDAMLEVFSSSPYFHIGGDESGAGSALIPFLAATNRHLRTKPPGQRKRLLVWEGFHGAPEELPARGEDRVVVVSWESAYNPPWSLLDSGYEIVNASWKPLYVVGGGTPRMPHIGGRKWSWRELLEWHKDEFWHWQLGTPVFEDRGPNDPHRNDGRWLAPAGQRDRILGGQLSFWEQREHTVLRDSWARVPALAESLWTGGASIDPVGFRRRLDAVDLRVRALVQPVRVRVERGPEPGHPTLDDFIWFDGAVSVHLETAGGPAGDLGEGDVLRATTDGSPVITRSPSVSGPLRVDRRTTVRARLFRNGEAVGAESRVTFDPRPAKVRCSWFRLPRRPLTEVPNFADRRRWRPERVDLLPELRGPYQTTHPVGQMMEATLRVPKGRGGRYGFRLQTRDGRAVLYVDGQRVLGPSDPREIQLATELELSPGLHSVRVDHASGPISPVVLIALRAPGQKKFVGIDPSLVTIPRGTEPLRLGPLQRPVDLLADGLTEWHFVQGRGEPVPADRVVQLEDGVVRIAGNPRGYLETRHWYRDYELDLEWRWPVDGQGKGRGGNSGVLVHATTPRMFYGWPQSLEVQLQSGAAGDFWIIGRDVAITVEDGARRVRPERPGNLHSHRRIRRLGPQDVERSLGQWNALRVRCAGGEIVVRVNGVEVQRGIDSTVREGAIALQSEGAPIEFRGIHLRPIHRPVR